MGTNTRYYGSGNTGTGVPTLANTAADLTNLLAACLYGSGFGSVTLTTVTRSGTTATATVSGGHGFLDKQVVEVAGANESEYNGTFRITYVSSTVFTYVMSADPGGSGTGTITAKLPAVGGWQALYSGTGKLALNSTDVSASGNVFRIDDTGTGYARIVGYESMTDVDTGTNPFPTAAQISGGGYLLKSSAATVRDWWLVADQKCCWIATSYDGTGWHIYGFGDFKSLYSGDLYNSFVMCAYGTSIASSAYMSYMSGTNSESLYVARNNVFDVGSVRMAKKAIGSYSGYGTTTNTPNYAYPSPTGLDLIVSSAPIMISEYQGELRGILYGARQIINKYSSSATPGEVRTGVPGFDDGLLILRESNPIQGCLAFTLSDWS